MQIFTRKKSIPISLGELNMKKIMNFPNKDEAGLESYYLKEIFQENHIQIGVVQSKVYTSGIHDFKYNAEKKEIKIFSRYKRSAFMIYAYLGMGLIPFIFGEVDRGTSLKIIGILILFFIGISLLLIMGIKSESKDIEREMIIRINYLRRNRN